MNYINVINKYIVPISLIFTMYTANSIQAQSALKVELIKESKSRLEELITRDVNIFKKKDINRKKFDILQKPTCTILYTDNPNKYKGHNVVFFNEQNGYKKFNVKTFVKIGNGYFFKDKKVELYLQSFKKPDKNKMVMLNCKISKSK